jgi:hypothetical protein
MAQSDSDSQFSLSKRCSRLNMNKIDDDWLTDCLSDDEIEIKDKDLLIPDENDDNENGNLDISQDEDEVWNDLGLETFNKESLDYK